MEKELKKAKRKKIKKKKFRRYFRYFLLGIAFLVLALQLYFTDFSALWEFDTILPIAVLVLIILILLFLAIKSKRYQARKRALKQKKRLMKLSKDEIVKNVV